MQKDYVISFKCGNCNKNIQRHFLEFANPGTKYTIAFWCKHCEAREVLTFTVDTIKQKLKNVTYHCNNKVVRRRFSLQELTNEQKI